mgnify:CR=1 FL=1
MSLKHPVLAHLALGYAPLYDAQRQVLATRLTLIGDVADAWSTYAADANWSYSDETSDRDTLKNTGLDAPFGWYLRIDDAPSRMRASF